MVTMKMYGTSCNYVCICNQMESKNSSVPGFGISLQDAKIPTLRIHRDGDCSVDVMKLLQTNSFINGPAFWVTRHLQTIWNNTLVKLAKQHLKAIILLFSVPFLSPAFLHWPSHCPLKPSPSWVTNNMLVLLRAMSDMKTCRPFTQRHCFTAAPVERQQNTYKNKETERGQAKENIGCFSHLVLFQGPKQ